MTDFETWTAILDGPFDVPLADLPPAHRALIEKEGWLVPWDRLSPEHRRKEAAKYWHNSDPSMGAVRESYYRIGYEEENLKTREIPRIEAQAARSHLDAEAKERRLEAKNARLAEIAQESSLLYLASELPECNEAGYLSLEEALNLLGGMPEGTPIRTTHPLWLLFTKALAEKRRGTLSVKSCRRIDSAEVRVLVHLAEFMEWTKGAAAGSVLVLHTPDFLAQRRTEVQASKVGTLGEIDARNAEIARINGLLHRFTAVLGSSQFVDPIKQELRSRVRALEDEYGHGKKTECRRDFVNAALAALSKAFPSEFHASTMPGQVNEFFEFCTSLSNTLPGTSAAALQETCKRAPALCSWESHARPAPSFWEKAKARFG